MGTVVLLLISLLSAPASYGARILGIVPTPSISHQLPFRLIALELARRGHQVTFITTDPIRENIQNYSEIDLSMSYQAFRTSVDDTVMSNLSPIDMMRMMPILSKGTCEIQLHSQQMKDFLQTNPSFDVVVLENLSYQCYYGLIHRLGSPPMVGFVSMTAPVTTLTAYGNPINPSYLPEFFAGYTDHMTFWQRLYNTYIVARSLQIWYQEVIPSQEKVLRKYFGSDAPPVYETERNFSLLLVNNHFNINFPRPLLPNVVELTGLHIQKQRRQLPQKIKEFLDGAKEGVIYFSLGSNVKSSEMPEHKKAAFLEAFQQLPQRVLWKLETEDIPGTPPNVMVSKWLPQQDVLAHPNVKLFITQGGLQSFNEASYFSVPLIGIPFIGDQYQNVAKMVRAEIGYQLLFKDVTTESVLEAVRTVLGDNRYRENMRRFSAVYREHQESSVERAVWWLEYVARHRGAPQLRSAALDLRWWQLLLLDVLAFVAAAVGLTLYLTYRVLKCVISAARSTSKQKQE